MKKVAEFISWKVKMDGNMDDMAVIISEASNQDLLESLVDVCVNPTDELNQRHYAMKSVEVLDDYLREEGYYKVMEDDKGQADISIIQQDALNAYNARMGL